jgi:hypothetical protein
MARIRERVPRDENGYPVFRSPQREAFGDLAGEYDHQPDSSALVDMDRETSIPYALGRLESLMELHKGTPGASKGHVKRGIAILQSLCLPSHESVQLGESYHQRDEFVSPPPPMGLTSDFGSSSCTRGTYSESDLATFAKLLRY